MQAITPVFALQVQEFLNSIGPNPGGMNRDVQVLRAESNEIFRKFSGPSEHVSKVEDVDAGGVRARLYSFNQDCGDVLVWFHGGAWMLGEIEDHDALACAIVNRAMCSVLSVEYRLAPEHRYPAAVDDSWAAVLWAIEHFENVAVGGDSSGGNLAAAVALRARDRGIDLSMELLVYPALDAELDSPFLTEHSRRYGEEARTGLRDVWDVYIPDPQRRVEVDASPIRSQSLLGLAPALIILAEHDALRGEGEEYARRLREDGVPVDLFIYPGQIHGFYPLLGVFDDAWDAVGRSARSLRAAFDGSSESNEDS
jgi:acetyl esterase